jgi:hypothetical protein
MSIHDKLLFPVLGAPADTPIPFTCIVNLTGVLGCDPHTTARMSARFISSLRVSAPVRGDGASGFPMTFALLPAMACTGPSIQRGSPDE